MTHYGTTAHIDPLAAEVDAAIAAVTTVYQPLISLETGSLVGYEALSRGPAGSPLQAPDALFAQARRAGRVVELDRACRFSALRTAVAAGLGSPATLFVNMEPETLGHDTERDVEQLRDLLAGSDLQIVLEITERALTARPADLLAAVAKFRGLGWRIALDDVGADPDSLALMPFLAPDIIKLDLRLVQDRTTVQAAEIVSAVNAQAERSGAVVLAEGIETLEHATLAVAMGARLGQGWLYGRPGALPVDANEAMHPLVLLPSAGHVTAATPWELVKDRLPVRRSTKPLLIAMSKHLEHQALADGGAAVVLGAFQQACYFTPSTSRRYATLASSAAFVGALGAGIIDEPATGVRGSSFPADDPLAGEWDLAVVGPHFAAALVARDLGDAGAEDDRRFDYTLTYDRDTAVAVAAALMARITPRPLDAVGPAVRHGSAAARSIAVSDQALSRLLGRAVDAATAGITIADTRLTDQPLVYVNAGFERLSGYTAEEVLGRNCRFMQGPGTDPATLQAMSAQLRAGREVRTTLRNYRPDGSSWWNEIVLSPVRDALGALTHYIGIQTDVTDRVRAEERVAYLATHDALTGLVNRSEMDRVLEVEVARAHRTGTSLALLYLDLDDFKAVNDRHGHPVGDRLLVRVAELFRSAVRPGDLLARQGGDEFAVLLSGLRTQDHTEVARVAGEAGVRLLASLADAITVDGHPLRVGTSIGIAQYPYDASTPSRLVATADMAMYAAKARGGRRVSLAASTPVEAR